MRQRWLHFTVIAVTLLSGLGVIAAQDEFKSGPAVGKTLPGSFQVVNLNAPKGKDVKDNIVGNYRVYEGTTVIKSVVERSDGDASPLTLNIDVQACNDRICLLPATITVKVPQP